MNNEACNTNQIPRVNNALSQQENLIQGTKNETDPNVIQNQINLVEGIPSTDSGESRAVNDIESKMKELGQTPNNFEDEIPAAELEESRNTIESKMKELEQMEKELNDKQLRIDTLQLLKEYHLPEILLEHAMGKDLEDTKKIIAGIQSDFNSAVQQQVTVRLRGKTPSSGTGTFERGFSRSSLKDEVHNALN